LIAGTVAVPPSLELSRDAVNTDNGVQDDSGNLANRPAIVYNKFN
jgi:hypothetical protein